MFDLRFFMFKISRILPYILLAVFTLACLHIFYNFPFWDFSFTITDYAGDFKATLHRIADILFHDKQKLLYAPFGFENIKNQSLAYNILEVLTYSIKDYLFNIIGLFTSDVLVVANIYYYLSFPLIALSFLFCARYLRISFLAAAPFAVLFAFSYYHFYRNASHITLTNYMLVPFYVLILLWLQRSKPLFFSLKCGEYRFSIWHKSALITIIVLAFLGPVSVYYLFYFLLLSFISLIVGLNKNFTRYHIISYVFILFLVCFSFYKHKLPDIAYSSFINPQAASQISQKSANVNSKQRYARYGEEELFALKMIQLVLPVQNHRLESFADLRREYEVHHISNENSSVSLGIIASTGFFILLLVFFQARNKSLLRPLAVLAIAAVLIGTVGGLGGMIPNLLRFLHIDTSLADVRAFARISIFITCCSCLGLSYLFSRFQLDIARRSLIPKGIFTAIIILTGIGIALFGIWDQTPAGIDYTGNKHEFFTERYLNDKEFIKKIEERVGPGASIFQLPISIHHLDYIYNPEQGGFGSSAHYTGYIHSRVLKWSFGADEGSPQARWYTSLLNASVSGLLTEIKGLGFQGIWIDCSAYPDNAKQIIESLGQVLGPVDLKSDNGRYVFFPLYPETGHKLADAEQVTSRKNALLEELSKPVLEFSRDSRYYDPQKLVSGWHNLEDGYRWTHDRAVLVLSLPENYNCGRLLLSGTAGKLATPLIIFVQGQKIIQTSLKPGEHFDVQSKIPQKLCQQKIKIEIRCKGWVPKQLFPDSSRDKRKLGVRIKRVAISEL